MQIVSPTSKYRCKQEKIEMDAGKQTNLVRTLQFALLSKYRDWKNQAFYQLYDFINNIAVKNSFSCINIRQVLWEVLKTEAKGYISHYFLHYFVSPFRRRLAFTISTDYARSRARQYTSRNGSKSVALVSSY